MMRSLYLFLGYRKIEMVPFSAIQNGKKNRHPEGHQAVDLALLGGLGRTSHGWTHGTMVPTGALASGPWFHGILRISNVGIWPKIMANPWFIIVDSCPLVKY